MTTKDVFKGLDNIDAILISNGGENAIDKAFFYFCGAESGLFEGSSLVIDRDQVKMFVFSLEEESAKATGLQSKAASSQAEMRENVVKELQSRKRIGVNMSSLTVNMYDKIRESMPNADFVDVSTNILDARMVKSHDEIVKLKEAARISAEIYDSVLDQLKEGMTENDVATLLVWKMMSSGASSSAFPSIVGFGPNAAIPHYFPGSVKLKKGDFVLTDYGAQFKRYCADRTRTAVFGKASEEQKEMYNVVYEAQSKSMAMIKSGENGKLVNQKAWNVIDSTKYKGRLMHGIGHGIGLEVHDHAALGSEDVILKENMAITVEPGVYIPGYGGVRIEDDVIVKKDGFELITGKPPAELVEV